MLSESPLLPPQEDVATGTTEVREDAQRAMWGSRPENQVFTSFVQHGKAPVMQRLSEQAKAYRTLVQGSLNEVVPWIRAGMPHTQRPTRRAFNILLSFMLLIALAISCIGTGVGAAADYFSLKGLAGNAVAALDRLPKDLGIDNPRFAGRVLSAEQRAQAQNDVTIALRDFQELNSRLGHPDPVLAAAMQLPKTAPLLRSAYLLSGVAIDAMQVVQQLFPSLVAFANVYNTSQLFSHVRGDVKPGGLTMQDMTNLQANLESAMPFVQDLTLRLQNVPAEALFAALSASQRAKIEPFLKLLPQIPAVLPVIEQFITAAPAILGIGQPAAYLIVTMDPAEIRGTGGFQGNYAVMEMRGGRATSLSLQDVYLLDRPYQNSPAGMNNMPPQQYLSWWPHNYLPWGLRDANLSPDFPTSAGYDIQQLTAEKGNVVLITDANGKYQHADHVTVTGVIAIEPAIISQLLQLTGPVTIGAPYNDVVTADNLQDKIHYYQLTTDGRNKGKEAAGDDKVSSANKRFTALLGKALLQRLRQMPRDKLFTYLGTLLHDLHNKDIQIAFTDPRAENFLRYYQISDEIYHGSADGLLVTDTNISGNKGSQFLQEQITDQVQLDQYGGATHTLTINYQWVPPAIQDGTNAQEVYNVLYDAESDANYGLFYRQYVRIYTGLNPRVVSASGWQFGGIDSTTSDFPGRGMLGAFYILQGNAQTQPVSWTVPNVTVTWYVPNAYTPGQPYTLHFQHQPGANQSLTLTITPPACTKGSPQTFTMPTVNTDWIYSVPTGTC